MEYQSSSNRFCTFFPAYDLVTVTEYVSESSRKSEIYEISGHVKKSIVFYLIQMGLTQQYKI